jgi:hypothetical protein
MEVWDAMYELILQYGREHGGDCNVPFGYVIPNYNNIMNNNIDLGRWLNTQRREKRKGTTRFPEYKRQLLQKLVDEARLSWQESTPTNVTPNTSSYVPVSNENQNQIWISNFALFIKYGKEHGNNFNVPVKYTTVYDDGSPCKLGIWLKNQRNDRKRNKMRPDRVEKFEAVVRDKSANFEWDNLKALNSAKNDNWNSIFSELIEYGNQHNGDCNVSNNYIHLRSDGSTYALGQYSYSIYMYKL